MKRSSVTERLCSSRASFWLVLLVGFVLVGSVTAEQSETVTYFHTDGLGSVIAATDESGNLLWRERYEPFGKRLEAAVPTDEHALYYTGKPHDDDIGLTYFGARYYDPVVGRFMGIDPAGVDPGNLHSFNRYAYANNNPYKYVDPDGNSPIDIAFLAYDIGKLGVALYTGHGVSTALLDVGASALGVVSPVPGVSQAVKTGRAAKKAGDAVGAANKTLVLGRQNSVMQRVAEGRGISSSIDSNDARVIFKKNYSDMRKMENIEFDVSGVPKKQIEVGENFEGGFSRAEEFMIRSRNDLLDKTYFIGER